jgi:hypothetical protein
MPQCRLLIAGLLVQSREVEVHVGDARVEPDGFDVLLDRFLGRAAIFEHDAEVEARSGVTRLELEGTPVEAFRFVERSRDVT